MNIIYTAAAAAAAAAVSLCQLVAQTTSSLLRHVLIGPNYRSNYKPSAVDAASTLDLENLDRYGSRSICLNY